jgi:sugar lactone lactonase YvrE
MLERFEDLVDGLNHPEGVAWSPFEDCVYAGGEGGELYRVTLEGEVEEVGVTGGSMLGLAVDGSGRVYACDEGRGEIARYDPTTRAIETYARGVGGEDLDTPNVAAFDASGNLYVTCSGEDDRPEIVRIRPGGTTERWTTAVPEYPNARRWSWSKRRPSASCACRSCPTGRPESRRRWRSSRTRMPTASVWMRPAASGSRCTGRTGSYVSHRTARPRR